MSRRILTAIVVLASATAFAQSDAPEGAKTLDELLRMVQQGRAQETQENRAREQRFAAAKADQQQLLREARQRKQELERRSDQLEAVFDRNEIRTSELTSLLDSRLGSLKEMFGVLQQVAGDARATFDSSVTTVQFPDRGEFLTELASTLGSTSRLASMEQLERLWFELQREMTESGKVVKFTTKVITGDGEEVEEEVVRVGTFNIVTDGAYLQFVPETGNVLELPRQPQARFVRTTTDLFNATEGHVAFGIDPSRGSILGLLVQTPNLRERIAQGGLIGYLIIALGGLALLIAAERLIVLGLEGRKVLKQLKSKTANDSSSLGRVLKTAEKYRDADLETLELKMGEAIIREAPKLSRGLLFLKIIAVVAPLMGLLGTVTGMINTFQAITLFGTGDPKLMAGGISQALVTTVLGLTVAIPTVLLHTVVTGRSRRIIHVLERQSTGIVADHAEKSRNGNGGAAVAVTGAGVGAAPA
ncbi:MAG TPA: MotA/TolQ/ExbB proton channel family protein [Candidatus Sulfomarinibacteraceae bacterium]|nr:MotA/TolQ/ExbB proton channel family protein [Candidatus Sulfomarinibacteraceae bacterium]